MQEGEKPWDFKTSLICEEGKYFFQMISLYLCVYVYVCGI